MAKRKIVKKAKKVVKKAKVARVVRKTAVKSENKRLSILLIVLAIAVFVLAAVSMTKGGI